MFPQQAGPREADVSREGGGGRLQARTAAQVIRCCPAGAQPGYMMEDRGRREIEALGTEFKYA